MPLRANVDFCSGSPKPLSLVLLNIAVNKNTIIGEVQIIEETNETGPRLVAFNCVSIAIGVKINWFTIIKYLVGGYLRFSIISINTSGLKNRIKIVEAPTQRKRYTVDNVVLSNAILFPKNPTPTAKLANARKGKALVGLKTARNDSFLKEIR